MNLPFTLIDFLVAVVILVSASYAAWRGFLSETLSIFAWAAAAFATLYFGPWLVPLARGLIATPWLASIAAYAGVFLVVFIPFSFMSHRFSETVKHSPIGPLDRALGVAFGVVRGLVVVGLAYLVFTYFVPVRQQPQWLVRSETLPLMQSTADVMLSVVPSRDHGDFLGPPPQKEDALGRLIRRQDAAAAGPPASRHVQNAARRAKKGYGAQDRRALDNLLEATGSGGTSKP